MNSRLRMERVPLPKLLRPEGVYLETFEHSFEELIVQMLPELRKGTFDTIIVDDTSARLFGYAFFWVCKYLHAKEGASMPRVRYMAGEAAKRRVDTLSRRSLLSVEYAKRLQAQGTRHVLFLSEYIYRGVTVHNFLTAFMHASIRVSVATLDTHQRAWTNERKTYQNILKQGGMLYSAHDTNAYNYTSALRTFSGVRKNECDVYARSVRINGIRYFDYAPARIQAARAYMKSIAQAVVERVGK